MSNQPSYNPLQSMSMAASTPANQVDPRDDLFRKTETGGPGSADSSIEAPSAPAKGLFPDPLDADSEEGKAKFQENINKSQSLG